MEKVMRRRPVYVRPGIEGPYNVRPKRTWVDSVAVAIVIVLIVVVGGLHLWGIL